MTRRITLCVFGASIGALSQQPGGIAGEYMRKYEHGEGKLKPGDTAPDFDLKKQSAGERVRLSSFKNAKPVALVFGSLT